MQTTVMSEGFLLNSKYIKMGREEGGFQTGRTQTADCGPRTADWV